MSETPVPQKSVFNRRAMLTAGSMAWGGFTLAELLRVEAAAGIRSSNKSIINIHLDGGPPHMDLWDLKPEAPIEIRGEFQPIATSVPGIEVCELLPLMARRAERFAFIRSLVGSAGAHDAFQCQSGFEAKDLQPIGGRPSLGSVVARLQGSTSAPAPAFVDLMQGRPLVRNSARPGFLGPSYQPFRPDISALFERPLEQGMVKELKAKGANHSISLTLDGQLTLDRIGNRTDLLHGLDRLRHEVDSSGMMDAMDRFTQQAVGILTSGRLAEALDFSRESPETLARYTLAASPDPKALQFTTADRPDAVKKFLLARRMIEAGVRVVSLSISDFDTHSSNFPRLRHLLPIVDQGIAALVDDLSERGLLDDVAIVAWGEFGRTPRVDPKSGGRHHWPQVGPALLAGGGLRTGQILGATDRTASVAVSRPVHYQDVFATLYEVVGINARATTIVDTRGRPQFLLDQGMPLRELV